MVSPQFTIRLLFVMMATCAAAFAALAQYPHGYMALAAATVPVFWLGLGATFVGSALESRGDNWLLPSVLIGVSGTLVCLLSIFTGIYYTMIAVVDVTQHYP